MFFNNIRSMTFTEYPGSLNIDYNSGHDPESLSETLTQRRTEFSRVSIINPEKRTPGS